MINKIIPFVFTILTLGSTGCNSPGEKTNKEKLKTTKLQQHANNQIKSDNTSANIPAFKLNALVSKFKMIMKSDTTEAIEKKEPGNKPTSNSSNEPKYIDETSSAFRSSYVGDRNISEEK